MGHLEPRSTCRLASLGKALDAGQLRLYWVPGAVEQAEARAHRLGSTHSKIVVEFLVGGCQNYGYFVDPHYNTAPNI